MNWQQRWKKDMDKFLAFAENSNLFSDRANTDLEFLKLKNSLTKITAQSADIIQEEIAKFPQNKKNNDLVVRVLRRVWWL